MSSNSTYMDTRTDHHIHYHHRLNEHFCLTSELVLGGCGTNSANSLTGKKISLFVGWLVQLVVGWLAS